MVIAQYVLYIITFFKKKNILLLKNLTVSVIVIYHKIKFGSKQFKIKILNMLCATEEDYAFKRIMMDKYSVPFVKASILYSHVYVG